MNENQNKIIEEVIEKLLESNSLSSKDIPHIPLYMDQVTTFMESQLGDQRRYADDKVITKTMINNYAKNKLLPAPDKKKYSEDHIILLFFIYYMKNVLSINDISTLLKPLSARYFRTDGNLKLSDIFEEIFQEAQVEKDSILHELLERKDSYLASFSSASEKDQDFLPIFSYITMLCYDVYVRKQVIEGLVDRLSELSDK